mmetsp:Transcript_113186/g.283324  ORF Transcript_113186/g.283324 Transcript_113186/m.283324 type:complete len:373 (+) Transcript_113186:136-1254(+)
MVSSPAGEPSSSGLGFPSNDIPPQLWTPPGLPGTSLVKQRLSDCSGGGASVSTRAASDGMPTPLQGSASPLLAFGSPSPASAACAARHACWPPCDLEGASPGHASAGSSSPAQRAAVSAPPGLAHMVLDECEGDSNRDPLSDLNDFLDAQRNSSGCFEGALPGEDLEQHHAAAIGTASLDEDDGLPDGQLPLLLGTTAEPYCPGELLAKVSLFGGDGSSGSGGGSSSSQAAASLPPPLPGSSSASAVPGYLLIGEPALARPAGPGTSCFSPASVPDTAAVAAAAAAAGEPLAVALPGSEQCPRGLPTVGSAGHQFRLCKPCAFVNTKGCKDGAACKFCHLCGPGEKKRRKKEKSAFWRTVNRWQRSESAQWP